jgi:hypothetical protein
MPIETYKCLIFRGSAPIWIYGLQIRITRCIVIGPLSKQQPFPVRERTFGELANGLCEWPLRMAFLPTHSCAKIQLNSSTFVRNTYLNFAAILGFVVLISRSPQPSRKSLIALLESAINEIIALLLTNQIAVILSCI